MNSKKNNSKISIIGGIIAIVCGLIALLGRVLSADKKERLISVKYNQSNTKYVLRRFYLCQLESEKFL